MKVYHDVGQVSPEWYELRVGLPTASHAKRLWACATGRISDGMNAYIEELIRDRECQLPNYFSGSGKPSTALMRRGIDLEPDAREWYAGQIGRPVFRVGFCVAGDGKSGCSPDLLVGCLDRIEKGGEIKILEPKKHARLVKANVLPVEFEAQVRFSMNVCELSEWDFILWNPPDEEGRPPENAIIRVEPNETNDKLRVALAIFHERFEKALRRAGHAA